MRAMNFPESNKELQKPKSMLNEECRSLNIYNNGRVCVSKWELSEEEKQHCLKHGYVWLHVISGHTQPPVLIEAKKEFSKL